MPPFPPLSSNGKFSVSDTRRKRGKVSWGCPPQTLTQETFREKFLGTSKASAKINWCFRGKFFDIHFTEITWGFGGKLLCVLFAKINWCFRCEVLWHTFLRKKGVCLPFLSRKVGKNIFLDLRREIWILCFITYGFR